MTFPDAKKRVTGRQGGCFMGFMKTLATICIYNMYVYISEVQRNHTEVWDLFIVESLKIYWRHFILAVWNSYL